MREPFELKHRLMHRMCRKITGAISMKMTLSSKMVTSKPMKVLTRILDLFKEPTRLCRQSMLSHLRESFSSMTKGTVQAWIDNSTHPNRSRKMTRMRRLKAQQIETSWFLINRSLTATWSLKNRTMGVSDKSQMKTSQRGHQSASKSSSTCQT